MESSLMHNLLTSLYRNLRVFVNWLIRPHSSVQDPELRRSSELFSSLVLGIEVSGIVLLVALLAFSPDQINTSDVRAIMIGLALAPVWYLVNRFGRPRFAMYAQIATMFGIFVLPSFWAGSSAVTLAFTSLAILFTGIFLPSRRFLIITYSVLGLSGIAIVANLDNPSSPIGEAAFQYLTILFFLIAISILISIFVTHLRLTEASRRAQLEVANERLRESEATLEKRVVERTHEFEVAKTAAERAEQVKSAFLASMSHELRTPLNAIINFAGFVVDGDVGPVNDEQHSMLTQVVDSAGHLLNLINDVLDMSKIESGRLALFIEDDVNLKALIDNAMSIGQGLLADKPVTLVKHVSETLPPVPGDQHRILQVLLNIISNACKFTDTGEIVVNAETKLDEVVISIKDNGPGIAENEHALVFEAFKQTDSGLRKASGTGLGMPISKNLVEAHGGKLWLTSTPGQGATFFVSLPIKRNVSTLNPMEVSVHGG
jgi:signal transduction histidine kinase